MASHVQKVNYLEDANCGGRKSKSVLFLNRLSEPFTIYENVSGWSAIKQRCAVFEWQWAVHEQLHF
jgi:hypothetical protein